MRRNPLSHLHATRANRFRTGLVSLFALLIFCPGAVVDGQAAKTSFSRDFQSFIQMVNDRYCVPKGWTVDRLTAASISPRYVLDFSVALGHALKGQYGYAANNSALMARYKNLQHEVLYDYLEFIQNRRGNNYPSAALMRNHVEQGMRGRNNTFTVQPGVQGGAVQSVFTGPDYGLQLPQGTPSSGNDQTIDLLGQKPPPGKKPPPEPKQNPQPAPPARKLSPDGVLGTWYARDIGRGSAPLSISKEGNFFVGKITGPGGTAYGWKRNEVCFRLQYAGEQGGAHYYSGKHNPQVGNPYDNFHEWRDITLTYWLIDGQEQFGSVSISGGERFKRAPYR